MNHKEASTDGCDSQCQKCAVAEENYFESSVP